MLLTREKLLGESCHEARGNHNPIRDIPQEGSLGPPEGLSETCVANLDNVHVVPKSSLGDLVGFLSPSREREVKRALGYALGWPELKVL